MDSQNSPLLHLHHATVRRGSNVVLHDLSLEIASGCSTVILGPNGSGKSTFLKVLTRELYPLAGPGSFVRLMGQEQWNVWAYDPVWVIFQPKCLRHFPPARRE